MLESMLVSRSVPPRLLPEYAITGHSGDSPDITFLDWNDTKPTNEAERYQVLEQMVAHSQFCLSGDHTCAALDLAIQSGS